MIGIFNIYSTSNKFASIIKHANIVFIVQAIGAQSAGLKVKDKKKDEKVRNV